LALPSGPLAFPSSRMPLNRQPASKARKDLGELISGQIPQFKTVRFAVHR
jgi:hypothetical protein